MFVPFKEKVQSGKYCQSTKNDGHVFDEITLNIDDVRIGLNTATTKRNTNGGNRILK